VPEVGQIVEVKGAAMSHQHRFGIRKRSNCLKVTFTLLLVCVTVFAQSDPGIRGGPAGAGAPFQTGLSGGQAAFFNNPGATTFTEVEVVSDGLGPRFNLNSCSGCHIHPSVGGSSPPTNNPEVEQAATMAPGNTIPSFITSSGPIREARFINKPDGTPDGGVHALFTISGRSDKPSGCSILQPDFSNTSNMIFRIPTPLFGDGLIEAISDTAITSSLAADPTEVKSFYGIGGRVNTSGNDGTVTRFGWKAQNKSLLVFAEEAYNVEMGVTNEGFPTEREEDPNCATNRLPESATGFDSGNTPADIVAFMGFMRFLDQPTPSCGTSGGPACSTDINNGKALFNLTGCATCHTASLTTGISNVVALNHVQANLYSDLALHHMGQGLTDGITQGGAGPDEFRTAPLWGVGQRAFFLHDGRTNDLLQAIQAHSSTNSEADNVITQFNSLTATKQQQILDFLRSL